ncbi:TIGR00725 family protein [Zhurongbacter thermophilus]
MYRDMFKVAVIGYAGDIDKPPVSHVADIALSIGKALGRERYVVLTGGRDGVMHLVSKGAAEEGSIVIGITPYASGGITPYAIEISTGLDMAMRSGVLLNSANAVISIGGAAGTSVEIFMAYSYRKPLILMRGTGGWTDRIIKILEEDTTLGGDSLDYRLAGRVYIADSVDEAMKILERIRANRE